VRRAHKDSRGVELSIGQKVAYNRSGDVIEGEIVGLGADIRVMADVEFWRRPFLANYPPPYPRVKPNVSRVRNGRSVLVLSDG
jgi:hypothetical protein